MSRVPQFIAIVHQLRSIYHTLIDAKLGSKNVEPRGSYVSGEAEQEKLQT